MGFKKIFSLGQNKNWIAFLVVLAAGGIFLFFAIRPYFAYKDWAKVTGIIESMNSRSTTTVIRYVFNGQSYVSSISEYSDTYQVGGPIAILVNPNYPKQIASDTVISHVALFVGAGIFIAVGLYGFIDMIVKAVKKKNVQTNTECETVEHSSDRPRPPYDRQ